ncbi:MAG: GCN5-related N-acetyltransferase [Herbinix sp.]|jgi:hypothetical protein|nr:GCN5-related N-acetyltransferase [Herbinix sp.]
MIKECNIDQLSDIVQIAFKRNNIPESNSAFCFKDYAAIWDDFSYLINNKQSLMVGYFEQDELIGVTGIFVDVEKKSADWVGPFIEQGDFLTIANAMLAYVEHRLQNVDTYHFFFHNKNIAYKAFMEENNIRYVTNEYSLILHRQNDVIILSDPIVEALPIRFKEKVKAKHNELYQDCFLSGEEMIDSGVAGRKVLCITKQEELVGYGTYHVLKNLNRAAIDILCVLPEYQACGYEESLLGEMIRNIFHDREINIIGLVLETKDIYLIEICQKLKFEITAENCSYERKV